MRIEDFNERLQRGILVADGAMGSMLYEMLGAQRSLEEMSVSQSEAVFRVHQLYIEAGAQLIETNTFGANRQKLAQLGMADRVAELNHRGVKIAREAREAAKHEVLIAGSIGPLGIVRQVQELPQEQVRAIFKEQAGALEERGVDLFLLETFSDIEELVAAIDAIRSFSKLPIVAELTFSEEGTTFSGTRPQDAWEALKNKNIQGVGANCTVGPQLLLPVLRELADSASLPLSAMPNAGFPKRMGDRIVYPQVITRIFCALCARGCRSWRAHFGWLLRDNTAARSSDRRGREESQSGEVCKWKRNCGGNRRGDRSRGACTAACEARAGEQTLGKDSGAEVRRVGGD